MDKEDEKMISEHNKAVDIKSANKMKISDLIEKLTAIKEKSGDLPIYMEILEEDICSGCGEPKTTIVDGFPDRISTGNLTRELHVWLTASERC
ncbi:hypothetical protein LCGC14_0376890 [marine sediment metagenome]|uniref:Uncharacterized protein n=1 Tax=marine sediment metagenome TaxID=412755 RepID=A0A0F9WCA9_9ZZZZ